MAGQVADHEVGCPRTWNPPGSACWCNLPEDHEMPCGCCEINDYEEPTGDDETDVACVTCGHSPEEHQPAG